MVIWFLPSWFLAFYLLPCFAIFFCTRYIYIYSYIYIQSMYSTFPYEKISNAQESQKNLGRNILKFVINVLSRRLWRTVKSGALQPMELQRVHHNLATEQQHVLSLTFYYICSSHVFFHLSIYLSILLFDAK